MQNTGRNTVLHNYMYIAPTDVVRTRNAIKATNFNFMKKSENTIDLVNLSEPNEFSQLHGKKVMGLEDT